MATFKQRRDSRILRTALDEVREIQRLLADVYRDAGDGQTIIRELVQNADDAGAHALVLLLLQSGIPSASNALLRGPALVAVNDGPLRERDWDGLHAAIGGAKGDEADKVGRFGLGLKSIFHVCEAFVYLGAEGGTLRAGVVNPWAGTDGQSTGDPLHPDWDTVADGDLETLRDVAHDMLGSFDDGLVVWVPLRQRAHIDRDAHAPYGIGTTCFGSEDLRRWFGSTRSLVVLLAQCGHLSRIEVARAESPGGERTVLASTRRPDAHAGPWIGRPSDDGRESMSAFSGSIDSSDGRWAVTGRESLGGAEVVAVKRRPDWPRDDVWKGGLHERVPRKALAHAAVSVIRPPRTLVEPPRRLHLRWAVFLPLENHERPAGGTPSVEVLGQESDPDAWEIVLHGYFLPSQDRRSIPGVTDRAEDGHGEARTRREWNRALLDGLLLPLLPGVLADALCDAPIETGHWVVEHIRKSKLWGDGAHAVTCRDVLVPVAREEGVAWSTLPSPAEPRVLAVPRWLDAPRSTRAAFLDDARAAGYMVIVATLPRLGCDAPTWPRGQAAQLLARIGAQDLASVECLHWVGEVLRELLQHAHPTDRDAIRRDAADWLGRRVGEHALGPAVAGRDATDVAALRNRWWRLLQSLAEEWTVSARYDSHPAIRRLGAAGHLGAGLLMLPFQRPAELSGGAGAGHLDAARVRGALVFAGNELDSPTSVAVRDAWLSVADELLGHSPEFADDPDIRRLPLVRVTAFPGETDSAWSIERVEAAMGDYRLFVPAAEESAAPGSSSPGVTDPRAAARDLASALGETVWYSNAAILRVRHGVVPSAEQLAFAVFEGDGALRSEPSERQPLLKRLASAPGVDPEARKMALRTLATGQRNAEDACLYYIRDDDGDAEPNQHTLRLLLAALGRPWCEVSPVLVTHIQDGDRRDLGLHGVDESRLFEIARQASGPLGSWSDISASDAQHLLRRLHSHDDRRIDVWRALPLHRREDGTRGPLTERTWRRCGDFDVPAELMGDVELLGPDPGLERYYESVEPMSAERVVDAMLRAEEPSRFAREILRHVTAPGGRMKDATRRALQDRAWIPLKGPRGAVAPGVILALPPVVEGAAQALRERGGLGVHVFPSQVDRETWRELEGVLPSITGRRSVMQEIHVLAGAVETGVAQRAPDFLAGPSGLDLSADLIRAGLTTRLPSISPGWALLAACMEALGEQESADSPGTTVEKLAAALAGDLTMRQQMALLRGVTEAEPTKDQEGSKLLRDLLGRLHREPDFAERVLSDIKLPAQDGRWHPCAEIARSESGVARRHRLREDLRDPLGLGRGSRPPLPSTEAASHEQDRGTVDSLRRYFEPWRGRVPGSAVGAFLSLFGDTPDGSLSAFTAGWIGEDVLVESIRPTGDSEAPVDGAALPRVYVRAAVRRGEHVEAVSLTGATTHMQCDEEYGSVFALDPEERFGGQRYWRITLADPAPETRTTPELLELLETAARWFHANAARLPQGTFEAWWRGVAVGSQTDVRPVRASILAHLPLTLEQLGVRDRPELQEALARAKKAQRRREQAGGSQEQAAAAREERAALDALAGLLTKDSSHADFLLGRVRALMDRYGYRPDSTLLELAQNADDALVQAVDLSGRELSESARSLVVRVSEDPSQRHVDVIHYGRPINETAGSQRAKDRQWDQDLYYMMLMNLSAKPGDSGAHGGDVATTGRFGLGFKSVHLVSDRPQVTSGFISFRVVAGLLPEECPREDDPGLSPIESRLPTRVRLVLRGDLPHDRLLDDLFARFDVARALLPALARTIREVRVEGSSRSGRWIFDPTPVPNAPGWSVGREPVWLCGDSWTLLRYRPGDADGRAGTAAVVVGLREGRPTPFPEEVPTLWNLTPSGERWGCGYVINGPFKLDPGRTHVSTDVPETLDAVGRLGRSLGAALVRLQTALCEPEPAHPEHGLPSGEEALEFLGALWTVLAGGLSTSDVGARKLLLRLHGPGAGVSHWMEQCSVVRSGLDAPFARALPALLGKRVSVVAGALADPAVRSALAEVERISEVTAALVAVTREVSATLEGLLREPTRDITASELLADLVQAWSHELTPSRVASLRRLASDHVWGVLDREQPRGRRDRWTEELRAMSRAGSLGPLRSLLLPDEATRLDPGAERKDELARASFAPPEHVFRSDLVSHRDDLTTLVRLRIRLDVSAETMAGWFERMNEAQRGAALRYLVDGEQSPQLRKMLKESGRLPSWLATIDKIMKAAQAAGVPEERATTLASELRPEDFKTLFESTSQQPVSEPPPEPLDEPTATRLLRELYDEWADEAHRQRQIAAWRNRHYPSAWTDERLAAALRHSPEDSEESHNAWMILLVLGTVPRLGRMTAEQYRGFMDYLFSPEYDGRSLWDHFLAKDATGETWFAGLTDWADSRSDGPREYDHCLSLLPELFASWNWIQEYAHILLSADRRDVVSSSLLRPRADPSQQLGGVDAPAAVAVRHHWVLRELARLGILRSTPAIARESWPPSVRLEEVLSRLGAGLVQTSSSFSRDAAAFVADLLPTPDLTFHRCFDLPLLSDSFKQRLDQALGQPTAATDEVGWEDCAHD